MNTPISPYMQKGSKLTNAVVLNLFRHTTYSTSGSEPDNTLSAKKLTANSIDCVQYYAATQGMRACNNNNMYAGNG